MANKDFDIIIVGSGAAGLSAAISAAEKAQNIGQDCRILLLERSSKELRGGNTRWSGAYFRFKDEDQIADNFIEDLESFSNFKSDSDYIKTLAEKSVETVAWSREKGVSYDFLPTILITNKEPRLSPIGGGRAIVDNFTKQASKLNVEIVYNSTAWKLTLDEEGKIEGMWVRDETGRSMHVTASVVILASGGFEGNEQMLTKYIGGGATHLFPIAEGGRFNKGEGIRMAQEIGAKTAGEFGAFHGEPVDPRSNREDAVVMTYPYGILVDKNGKRFRDEGITTVDEQYEETARNIFELPGNRAYFIFDEKVLNIPGYEHAVQTEHPPIMADTIEELAEKVNLPVETVAKTIKEYNKAVKTSKTVSFDATKLDGKKTEGVSPPKSNWAIDITKPPYMCYPVACSIVFTFGGLATDVKGKVLSEDDIPIPGLYAAGEITGLYYGKYTGSTSVLRSMVFGKISGEEAVQYINQNIKEIVGGGE